MKKQIILALLESIIITIIFIWISHISNDTLSLNSPFPWIWFAPILIAQRYGLWYAMLSTTLILSSAIQENSNILNEIKIQLFILGGFIMTIISSIFHGHWKKINKQNQDVSEYLSQRIQSIAESYECTNIAYKTIMQNYILKPVTIRSSLSELRELIAKQKPELKKLIFERLINILAQQCSLEKTGIFFIENKKLSITPLVSVGNLKPLNPNNPLISNCIEQNVLTYIHPQNISKEQSKDILIVAPLVDYAKNIYALLIIESMPFLKYNFTNIESINILLQYFLDGHTPKPVANFLNKFPTCPVEFANEMYRLLNLYQSTKQDSALIVFYFKESSRQKEFIFRVIKEKRGLDCLWEFNDIGHTILLKIMPLTNLLGINGYKTRINNILESEFNSSLNQTDIQFSAIQISSIDDPLKIIENIESRC